MMIKSSMNNLKQHIKFSKPFAAFIYKQYYSFKIYLVNPTNTNYFRVVKLTGGFASDDDVLVETSKVMREIGTLSKKSYILLEESNSYDLDFVIWYHLDLYSEQTPTNPEKVWFDLPKYGWGYEDNISDLPILNTKGMMIDLKNRNELSSL